MGPRASRSLVVRATAITGMVATAMVGAALIAPAGPSPAAAEGAAPTKATLGAVADSYTESSEPNENHGGAGRLPLDESPRRRAWYKFDLPDTPTSATLWVWMGSESSDGIDVNLASSEWSESTITDHNAPDVGGVVGTVGDTQGGEYNPIALDVSQMTTEQITLMLSRAGDDRGYAYSRESEHPAQLVTTYADATPTPTPTATPTSTPTPTPTSTPTSTPTPTPTAGGGVTKVLLFVEENSSFDQMKSAMPFTFGLAQQYGYATSYDAIRHPSLPNYLAIAGGDTYGVDDDQSPAAHHISGPSVFGQALALGETAKVYAEGMTSNCQLTSSGTYAVRHNPWAYFTDTAERDGCKSFDVPEVQLASDVSNGALPNVGMVVPDLCHDAHDCSLGTADDWFKSRMQAIMAGPDWASGHLAVVLTADEAAYASPDNRVLTVVMHPSLDSTVVSTPLTHYSLTALLDDVIGAAPRNNAATAPDMRGAFQLP
jgi:phosphatidylinositol-3-phosphatase